MNTKQDRKIALANLLVEVSVILASRQMDFDVLQVCYDKYMAISHTEALEHLGEMARPSKPGPTDRTP